MKTLATRRFGGHHVATSTRPTVTFRGATQSKGMSETPQIVVKDCTPGHAPDEGSGNKRPPSSFGLGVKPDSTQTVWANAPTRFSTLVAENVLAAHANARQQGAGVCH